MVKLITFFLILSCTNVTANPLKHLLMLKMRASGEQSLTMETSVEQNPTTLLAETVDGSAGGIVVVGGSSEPVCEAVEVVKDEARETKRALETQLDELRVKNEQLGDKLERTEESLARTIKSNEELIGQVARADSKATQDLSELRKTLAATEKRLTSTTQELRDTIKLEKDLATKRVEEAEKLCRREVELGRQAAEIQLRNAEQQCADTSKKAVDEKHDDLILEQMKIRKLEEDRASILGEKNALQKMHDQVTERHEAKLQETEEQKLKYFEEKLHDEVARLLGIREKQWNLELQEMSKQGEVAVMEAQEIAEQEKTDLRESLEEDCKYELELQKEKHDTKIDKLQDELRAARAAAEDLEGSHASAIREMREEAEENRAIIREAHAKDKAALMGKYEEQLTTQGQQHATEKKILIEDYEKKLTEYKSRVDSLERSIAQKVAKISDMEQHVQRKTEEVDFWQGTFHRRSYVNVTHVHTDFVDELLRIRQRCMNSVQKTTEKFHRQLDEFKMKIGLKFEPYIRYINNSTVVRILGPYWRRFVTPIIVKIEKSMKSIVLKVSGFFSGLFESTVKNMDKFCYGFEKAKHRQPQLIQRSASMVCNNTRQYLTTVLTTIVIVLLILFRKVVWQVAHDIFTWCRKQLWRVSPLRLILKPKQANNTNEDDVPVGNQQESD